MRILWFANTACNAAGHMGEKTIAGGWLQSLDLQLQEKVDLHVAFYANWHEKTFNYGKATYHVIPPDNIRKSSLTNIFKPHVITNEDVDKYLAIIDTVKPDIIHVHGTENPFGAILNRTQLPVLNSLQGIVAPYAHHVRCDAYKELLVSIPKKAKGLKGKLLSFTPMQSFKVFELMAKRELESMKKYKIYIGRTDWDRRVCTALSPDCQYYVGDDILRDVFYGRYKHWKPIPEREKLVLHTTISDNPIKGFSTIVETIPVLQEAGLNIEWKVAGVDDTSDMVRIAKRMYGKQYPSSALTLLGTIPADVLADELMLADIYVHPSFGENSANSLCEAMLMGLPCIATAGGGTMSVITDGVEGLLVQIRDPWALAGTIAELAKDRERGVEMGRKAAERARVKHDPVKCMQQVYNTYLKILQKS